MKMIKSIEFGNKNINFYCESLEYKIKISKKNSHQKQKKNEKLFAIKFNWKTDASFIHTIFFINIKKQNILIKRTKSEKQTSHLSIK